MKIIKYIFPSIVRLIFPAMILCLASFSLPVSAQQRVKLKSSDYVEGGRKNNVRYNKAIGNVHFIQGTMDIYCDSALLYKKENSLEAYGHIKIFDTQDSVTITSNKLIYAGDTRFAQLRDNVVYKDDSITLFTDHLDYNIDNRSVYYFDGGRILNQQNVLTSKTMFYDTPNRKLTFHKKVVLVNPENTLKTDTLIYDMVTGKATTYGSTTVTRPDGTTVNSPKGGIFLVHSNQTTIETGTIETASYILKGTKLFYDQVNDVNRAVGNVYMYSKENDIIITGDQAENDGNKGITKVYGHPVLRKMFEGDTLYLTADTLVSIDSKADSVKKLLAFHHVKFYRYDLQGIADSISYVMSDSMLYMYKDPVIWNTGNQAEGDTIRILFTHNQIDQMKLSDDSFIIMIDTLGNYNQLKGKIMITYFVDNKISRLSVNGNGECLYYALDEKDNSLKGVNKIVCSSMMIRFINNHADNMTFYTNPEGTFIPPQLMKKGDDRLSGFNWRSGDRPTLVQVLSAPPEEKETTSENSVESSGESSDSQQ